MASLRGHTQPVTSISWSPDGTRLASGSLDGTVRIWTASGNPAGMLDPGAERLETLAWKSSQPVFRVAWSLDGKLLAVGAIKFSTPSSPNPDNVRPGIVRLWRTDGRLERTLKTSLTGGKFLNLAWSPDGTYLAAGAVDYHIWRADGTEVGRTQAAGPPAWAMAWAPDSRELAVGDENGLLRLYDTAGNATDRYQSKVGGIFNMGYSPDGRLLAVGNGGDELRLRADLAGAATALDEKDCCFGNRPAIAWSADGGRVAGGAVPMVWDSHGVALYELDGCPGKARTAAWSPDALRLAVGFDQGGSCVWRVPAP